MLEDTPVEEAAGATITPADDDSELSDNDMERLMNMNLDDLIDDVKADTDSISIDDLLNQGDELKNAEAQAQAQALAEELAEKEKNDSQVNETEPDDNKADSDNNTEPDAAQTEAGNEEADNKEPEKKESVQVDESKIKPVKPKKDSLDFWLIMTILSNGHLITLGLEKSSPISTITSFFAREDDSHLL